MSGDIPFVPLKHLIPLGGGWGCPTPLKYIAAFQSQNINMDKMYNLNYFAILPGLAHVAPVRMWV